MLECRENVVRLEMFEKGGQHNFFHNFDKDGCNTYWSETRNEMFVSTFEDRTNVGGSPGFRKVA